MLEVAGVVALADALGPELLPRNVPPKRLVAECSAEEALPLAPVAFPLADVPVLPEFEAPPDVLLVGVDAGDVVEVLPPELSR